MIVQNRTDSFALLFTLHGSVLPKIIKRVLFFTLLSIAFVLIHFHWLSFPNLSSAPFAVFGIALSLFLGFRNNAAYDRWWEGRKQWGQLIADMRALSRELSLFVPNETIRFKILRTSLAFIHLHRINLRNVSQDKALEQWLDNDLDLNSHPPCDALNKVALLIAKNTEDGFGKKALSERLASITATQAACERIQSTPLPYVYTLLVFRTTCLYCLITSFALVNELGAYTPVFVAIMAYVFFGLAEVTEELSHPFLASHNGLPLDAMCRVIERSISPHLNIEAPALLNPKGVFLS